VPSIYTMADVKRFVALPEYWEWVADHRPDLSLYKEAYCPIIAEAHGFEEQKRRYENC
jgi:hypothetical protein